MRILFLLGRYRNDPSKVVIFLVLLKKRLKKKNTTQIPQKNLFKKIYLIQSIDFLHSHSCSAHEAQLHSKPEKTNISKRPTPV